MCKGVPCCKDRIIVVNTSAAVTNLEKPQIKQFQIYWRWHSRAIFHNINTLGHAFEMSGIVININATEFKAGKSFLFELIFTANFGIEYAFNLKYGMFAHILKKFDSVAVEL